MKTLVPISPKLAWLGFVLVALTYFAAYGLLVFPSSITEILKVNLVIDDVHIGRLASMFLYTYVLLQVPAGIILDRFPLKRVILVVILTMAIGCFIMASSQLFVWIIVSRLLMGAAASFTYIASLTYVRLFFPVTAFALMAGLTEAMSGLGMFSFNAVFSGLTHWQSWRTVTSEIGILILLLGICVVLFVPMTHVSKGNSGYSVVLQFKIMAKRRRMLLAGVFAGLSFAHFLVLTNLWNVTFFAKWYHITVMQAVWANTLTVLGFVIGGPLNGYLTRYVPVRKLLVIMSVAEVILLVMVHHFSLSLPVECVSLFLLGISCSCVILIFAIIKAYVPGQIYGLSAGFINMFFGGTGIVVTPIVSSLYQYTKNDSVATLPLIVCSMIALACAVWIYCLDKYYPIKPFTYRHRLRHPRK